MSHITIHTEIQTEIHTVTAMDVAHVLGITVRAVNKRVRKEKWPATVLNRRGDRRFKLATLPEDVNAAFLKERPECRQAIEKHIERLQKLLTG